MIKKMLILVAAIISVAATVHAEIPTPNAVLRFYEGMAELSHTSDRGKANEIESEMRNCVKGMIDSGTNLPNDFRYFDCDKDKISHTNKTLTSNNYIYRLMEYSFSDKILKINVRILSNKMEGSLPDFQSTRLAATDAYIMTNIVKTFTINGVEKVFNDTVMTEIETGLIKGISNGMGFSGVDKNALRIKAAQAYGRKNYDKAYKYYEQIISIDPDDADAYYRLGLMTYWLQGCESKFRKKRYAHNKGKEYLTLAWQKGTGAISMKAKRVLHWMYNPYM